MHPRDAGLRIKRVDYQNVDVMINGKVLIDGQMIPRANAVKLIQEFAQKFGPVIVETEELDQRVERDVVYPDGTVEPFINIAGATKNSEITLNTSLVDSIERAVSTGVVESAKKVEDVPHYSISASLDYVDVEGELAKLAGAGGAGGKTENRPGRSTSPPRIQLSKPMLIAGGAAVAAAAGVIFFLL